MHIYGIRSATDRKKAYGYDWEQEIEDVVTPIGLFHSKLQSPVAVLRGIKFFLNHFPNAILTTSTIDFNVKIEYPCCSGFMEQRYVRVLNAGKRLRQV
ncbi:hypothetical protein [Sphingobacterium composti Ten et al. 2007 non Yoo et al. 2007]|uniref:hypothetical protein n=1 Tax=Sphingobacterium composti TaxID=363260 RepID=UPI001358D112|nr:hypothetical protein [Sphingobacterium composti Ten et al. 2007 non Yoo et al. 2007]